MASQNKTENLGLCQFGNNDIPDWRTDYTGDMAIIDKQIKGLSEKNAELSKEVENVKKSVSDGKSKVASAITDKGVATEATDTFDVMAENIGKIQTGTSNTQILSTTMISGVVQCRVTHDIDNTLD